MEYRIPYIDGLPDWNRVPSVAIACYPWDENGFRPASAAAVCFVKDRGLIARLHSHEQTPLAVNRMPNSPVYEDSCLEFFLQKEKDGPYINFETNSTGALLCAIGKNRYDRVFLSDKGYPLPVVTPFTGEDNKGRFWGVTVEIPENLLIAAFGCAPREGTAFRGNFYKCGDKTPLPHYGCWSPIRTQSPDFHQEEYFGDLIISAAV